MPQIPRFHSTQAARSGITIAQRGQGFTGIANAVGNVADDVLARLERKNNREKQLNTASALAQARLDLTKRMAEMEENVPENPRGFTEEFEAEVDKYSSRVLDSAGDTIDAAALEAGLIGLKSQVVSRAVAFEAQKRGQFQSRQVAEGIDNLAVSMFGGGTLLDDAFDDLGALVDASQLPEAKKAELRAAGRGTIVNAMIQGRLDKDRNPDEAEALLEAHKDDLTAPQVESITNSIRTTRRSIEAELAKKNVEARQAISEVKGDMVKGRAIDPDVMRDIDAQVAAAPDPAVRRRWAALKAFQNDLAEFTRLPPDQMDAKLAEYQAAVDDGVSGLEGARLDAALAARSARATEINREFKARLEGVDARLAAGNLSDDEVLGIVAFVNENQNVLSPENIGRVEDLLASGAAAGMENVAPEQAERALVELRNRAETSEFNQVVYETAAEAARKTKATLSSDPVRHYQDVGVVTGAVDMNDPGSLQARHQEALEGAAQFRQGYSFFTETEVAQITQQMTEAPVQDILAFATNLADITGDNVGEAMEPFEKTMPVLATVGAMLSQDATLAPTAERLVTGWRMKTEGGVKLDATAPAEIEKELQEVRTKWANSMDPAVWKDIRDNAEYMLIAQGDLLANDADDAVEAAVGRTDSGGGFGSWNGEPVILPLGVTEDQFEDALDAMQDEDLAAVSLTGEPPIWDDEVQSGIPIDTFREEIILKPRGPGVYEAWAAGFPVRTPSGQPYVMDLRGDAVRVLLGRGAE